MFKIPIARLKRLIREEMENVLHEQDETMGSVTSVTDAPRTTTVPGTATTTPSAPSSSSGAISAAPTVSAATSTRVDPTQELQALINSLTNIGAYIYNPNLTRASWSRAAQQNNQREFAIVARTVGNIITNQLIPTYRILITKITDPTRVQQLSVVYNQWSTIADMMSTYLGNANGSRLFAYDISQRQSILMDMKRRLLALIPILRRLMATYRTSSTTMTA